MARVVVDGMNVMGSRPDGWWRDRDAAVRRLLDQLRQLVHSSVDDVTLVLDGRPLAGVPAGESHGVHVVYARRGGRNAADDRIVELVAGIDDPGTVSVVTSDRDLADRVRALGATVTGAGSFVRRLERS
jgi:predicted RNA-binding protein with PIN domain